jgi:hypothetical protein
MAPERGRCGVKADGDRRIAAGDVLYGVGILTGHDTMIDAPYTGQVVRKESFKTWWASHP